MSHTGVDVIDFYFILFIL